MLQILGQLHGQVRLVLDGILRGLQGKVCVHLHAEHIQLASGGVVLHDQTCMSLTTILPCIVSEGRPTFIVEDTSYWCYDHPYTSIITATMAGQGRTKSELTSSSAGCSLSPSPPGPARPGGRGRSSGDVRVAYWSWRGQILLLHTAVQCGGLPQPCPHVPVDLQGHICQVCDVRGDPC